MKPSKPKQIVYIHIPKSAGTAQRALFWEVYGKAAVCWFGEDSSARIRLLSRPNANLLVLGGHRDISFFNFYREDFLFASVVRDPVSRAVSLFNYHANINPDRKRYLRQGFNPKSMLESINKCRKFRSEIVNRQCKYLSGKRSFAAALGSLQRHSMIVGCFDALNEFNHYLANLLDWRCSEAERHNQAPHGYQDRILEEPNLVNKIIELNQEDQQLYDLISRQSVMVSLPNSVSWANLTPTR